MSEVQGIFDKVIEGGYYGKYHEFMCMSLREAFRCGHITYGDYMYASDCIKAYMGVDLKEDVRDVRSLVGLLKKNNLPRTFNDTLAIYKDWENKPVLKESL